VKKDVAEMKIVQEAMKTSQEEMKNAMKTSQEE
jgi:hypothetical protein